MTRDVYKGLKEPADELDVVEAYGGEGKGQPNQRGYWVNSHYRNQGPDGGKDETQDRFSGMIEMTKLAVAGGSSWYETFHTYGVLVGEEETVYYCDEIEVARHRTARRRSGVRETGGMGAREALTLFMAALTRFTSSSPGRRRNSPSAAHASRRDLSQDSAAESSAR
jgi:hypothetical protein